MRRAISLHQGIEYNSVPFTKYHEGDQIKVNERRAAHTTIVTESINACTI
jgi:hypothetical protein